MRLRTAIAVLAGVLTTVTSTQAGAKPRWIELRTPHFLVITNGSQKQARHIGLELEQIRAALLQSFPGFTQGTPDDMVVLALKNQASMLALASAPQTQLLLEQQAGVFLGTRERGCVLLRLDREDDNYHPAYHEYVHALLAMNFPHLPLWLEEGLADFYAGAHFDPNGARIGGDAWQTSFLRDRALLPLATLRALDTASPIYRDSVRAQLFYAQSWALIHFLIFGPGMAGGSKFNQYLARLQRGDDEDQAFAETFGPIPDLQLALDRFRRRFALPALHLTGLPVFDPASFDLRPLPEEEWSTLQSSLDIPDRLAHSPAALPHH